MTTEHIAALEEQRDVLLTSLRDLEQERATGDIGDADYAVLRDDYTARAATVLRAIEAGRADRRAKGRSSRPSASRTDGVRSDRTRAGAARTGAARTGTARNGTARTGTARTGTAGTDGERTAGDRTDGRRSDRARTGRDRPGVAASRTGGARRRPVASRTGTARTGTARTATARTGRARPRSGASRPGSHRPRQTASRADRDRARSAASGADRVRTDSDLKARRRRSLTVTLVVALAVVALAGGSVAYLAGDREPGEPVTGSLSGGTSSPSSSSDRLAQALALETDGRAVDALKLYDEILTDEPDNVGALAYRGWLLKRAGLPDKALESLDRAVAADPTFPDAHFFRGMVLYQDRDDPAGAVAEFEAFLANDPPPDFVDAVREVLAQAQTVAAARATAPPPPAAPAADPAPAPPAG